MGEMAEATMYCPATAAILGESEGALFLRQLHYWINLSNGGVEAEGRKWIYKTYDEWQQELFPHLSVRTTRRIIGRLRDAGLIMTRQSQYHNLYRINYEKLRDAFNEAKVIAPRWIPPEPVQLLADVEIALAEATLTHPVSAWPVEVGRVDKMTTQGGQNDHSLPYTENTAKNTTEKLRTNFRSRY